MATHAFHVIQRLSRVLDAGIRTLNSTLRRASTSKQTRIVMGPNNERIIMSPYGEVSYPETLIHEFVWNNSENYPNHIALVIFFIYWIFILCMIDNLFMCVKRF